MYAKILLSFLFILTVNGKNIDNANENREGKMFGYQYTSTTTLTKMLTSMIPSSCVQVEASLPPCRNVRNMDAFPRFMSGRVLEEGFARQEILPSIHTTALGWGEYFGIYAPTVTITAVNIQTTTVADPKTIVTFSVRGCRPSRLPLDLNLCPKQDISPTPATQTTIETTTVHGNLNGSSTELPSESKVPIGSVNGIEGSEDDVKIDGGVKPTEILNKKL